MQEVEKRESVASPPVAGCVMALFCLGLTVACLAAVGGLLSLVMKDPAKKEEASFIWSPCPKVEKPVLLRRSVDRRDEEMCYPVRRE